ncbi:nucleotidyltransferase domain-containing protein [Facilibium subflavum]|uniref:nucleotidyltransferase domain-containing protein n=1 Tax=Facilibium subflavum TaxID=2219058 RepID=UPI000E65BD27|nr:nucleotidyltransferase domain-containing protein [Facilibium subflavum]
MILRDEDKKRLLNIAETTLKTPCEIWAYGSRVDGSAHDTSDLDIVIRTADLSPLPIEELSAFKQAVHDSNIPILVQVSDWARMPEYFHSNILANYEVLKCIK